MLQQLHRLHNAETQIDTGTYAQARRNYKTLLKKKQEEYLEQKGQKIITLAETNPYAALQPRKTIAQDIQMEEWVEHFKAILNTENTTQAYNTSTMETGTFHPITEEEEEEITEAILELNPGKRQDQTESSMNT